MVAPPRNGKTARKPVMTAEFWPSSRALSIPDQWSLMRTTTRLMRPADPRPWMIRTSSSHSNDGLKPPRLPTVPNTRRQGTRMRLRPYRSARKPIAGAATMPVSVPAAMSMPARETGSPYDSRISGVELMRTELLRRAIAVTEKTRRRDGRPVSPGRDEAGSRGIGELTSPIETRRTSRRGRGSRHSRRC